MEFSDSSYNFLDRSGVVRIIGLNRIGGQPRKEFSGVHLGPVPNGHFWALAAHNDLPGGVEGVALYVDPDGEVEKFLWTNPTSQELADPRSGLVPMHPPVACYMEWDEFFARHERVWWRDAQDDDSEWVEIHSEKDLPDIEESVWEDYDAVYTGVTYNFMVELYAIKRRRGK